ncbi:Histone deacetylase hda1 [Hypoxylon texense]
MCVTRETHGTRGTRETRGIRETWVTAGDGVIGAAAFAEALRDALRLDAVHLDEVHPRAGSLRDGMTEIGCDLLEGATTQDEDLDLRLREIVPETERPRDVHLRLPPGVARTEVVLVVRIDETIATARPTADVLRHPVTLLSPQQYPLGTRPADHHPTLSPFVATTARDRSPQSTPKEPPAPSRSPPRGPAALRAPTGPRETRNYDSPSARTIGPPPRPAAVVPIVSGGRDINSGAPPSGPRGYVASRGGGYSRGRGGPGWGSTIQSRNLPPAAGPASASAATGSSNIPTGPRGGPSSQSVPSTPINSSKPFNPPKGPAAESNRPSLAQQLLATIPPIVPGGKMDPHHMAIATGVLPELQAHMQQLKEEEEKIRAEKYIKEEKLRKNLAIWEKMEREAKVLDLRLELSENSVKKFAGEGVGGAAF